MKPSTNWIEAGSGKLGKVYLEIIRCDGLPNKDKGLSAGGMTDAFCTVVYEDAIVSTDVINDELDPRWMPWTQRAFVFHMQHPSSQILIGVFDYDSETKLNSHDKIGRVAIDVTNFRAQTEYLLHYDLYNSVLKEDRAKMGKLTVRLRIEWKNYRSVVTSALGMPAFNYINLAQKNDFKTTFFVCSGDENLQKLDMDALKAYANELSSYADIQYDIVDALQVVLLWRGHFPVNLFGLKFRLPIHSMVAFSMGVTLIENLNLLPSYWLFAIAWFLLATNGARHRNPSPWHRSLTFGQMWYCFLADSSPPVEIADNENEAAIRRFEEAAAERRKGREEDKEDSKEAAAKLTEFLSNEDEDEAVDGDLSTKVSGGVSVNPLKPILLPLQKVLGMICKALRIVCSIVTWDESLYAFVLTNVCLIGGLALIWVPWSFVMRWTARILVWTVLGPWMKLVDIFVVQKFKGEQDEQFKRIADKRLAMIADSKRSIMVRKENLMKLSAIKRYMFGKYVVRVPQFKEYRYEDVPLAESTATPCKGAPDVKISQKKHGQLLVGDMIPRWADSSDDQDEKKED